MLGLGSLTLPSVFARLGWIPAVAVVMLCGLGTVWAGRLFALLAVKVRPCSAQYLIRCCKHCAACVTIYATTLAGRMPNT